MNDRRCLTLILLSMLICFIIFAVVRHGADTPQDTESMASTLNEQLTNNFIKHISYESSFSKMQIDEYQYSTGRLRVNKERSTPIVDMDKLTPEEVAEYIQNAQNVHEVDCSRTQRVGSKDDGGWDLCLVGPYKPRNPCIAITFGIDNKWLFDEELAKNFHCKVHAFDPTINDKPGKHSENVWYYKLGLSDHKGNLAGVGPIDTLANIIEMVGAKDQEIDIVKMDIEGSEYPALQQAIKDGVLPNVRQIMLEFHTTSNKPSKEEGQRNQEVLKGLWDLGFRVWKYDWNIYNIRKSAYGTGVYRTTCNEVYMININYAKEGRLK